MDETISERLRIVLNELSAIGQNDPGDGSPADQRWIAGWDHAVLAVEELLIEAGLLRDPESLGRNRGFRLVIGASSSPLPPRPAGA